jgi:dye decolorizing peroxidase/deferrochelatase/peroxidase EfeB
MAIDRRTFLTGGSAGLAGLAGGVLVGRAIADGPEETGSDETAAPAGSSPSPCADATTTVAFRGDRQAGIDTPPQQHAAFAAFDVTRRERAALATLMATWTDLAEQLTAGATVADDTGEATGLGPNRLTVTFGFGASLFDDACAPASARPAGLVDLPEFPGDQLEETWNGGDLLVQVCADDPTVVSHALRQLRRTGQGVVGLRWTQIGFLPHAAGATPRNLFGQVDGTVNPASGSSELDDLVWVTDGPGWMTGGTYLATRRIRMMLTMWDRMGIDVQEATVGRHRDTGAPLTGGDEFTEPDLDATADGAPVIAPNAHVRLAKTAGPGMLRRGYSYDNGPRATGTDMVVPGQMDHAGPGRMNHSPMDSPIMGSPMDSPMMGSPMRAAMDDHDAGLFFAAYVRDPATQFVPMQQALSSGDALGHFLAYTSAGLWAIPAGATSGAVAAELFA